MLLLFLYLFLFFPEAFEVCKRRIIALNGLPGIPQHFTDDERDIHMSSLVPFDSSNMVSLEQVSGLYPSRSRNCQNIFRKFDLIHFHCILVMNLV